MRLCNLAPAVLFLVVPSLVPASSTYIVPTTTLAAQTSNNTSAANGFASQSNGNRGAGNVSKVDIHTLLYPGATTKIYAHLLVWFGESKHMNIGYSSTDAAQIKSQISDMISRGIDGVIIDWYGPNNSIDQATQLVMAEAEKHPGFTFAVMVDQGAIEWDSCSGCSPQQAVISQLQYIERTYFSSPAYMTIGGQPVITNFNLDLSYSLDWNALNASLSTHPLFWFQNNDGFSHILSGGSYSWVMPTTTDFGAGYLSNFYQTGMSFLGEDTVGAAYKGFNDTLASWGSNRIMKQQCGQTWLQTFSDINSLYNSGKQLPDLQLVTWNDYEEATEIESGIDNCVTVSGSAAANALQWAIAGDENTIDHYTVYISTDGQNLMPLTDMATGQRSLDLCSFPIPAGNYTLYVQAVGKPSLANQMSGAIKYNPSCNAASGSTAVNFNASPSSITIPAGHAGHFTVSAKAQSGAFNSPISLSCSAVPSTLSCSFSPTTITPGSGTGASTLTVAAVSGAPVDLPQQRKPVPIQLGWLLSFGVAGGVFGCSRRQRVRVLFLVTLLGVGMGAVSCGGPGIAPGASSSATVPNSYTVTIHGTAGTVQLSTTVEVTIQ